MRTLQFRHSESRGQSYFVLIHSREQPDQAEWKAYMQALDQLLQAERRLLHVFVATDGGGPNAAQRKALSHLIADSPGDALTHVFTTERLVRGVVTAFRWITRAQAIAYTPEELPHVCDEYKVALRDVTRDFTRVQAVFQRVQTLELMLTAASRALDTRPW